VHFYVGLTSEELTRILHAFGYNRKHAISPAAWAMFLSALRRAIYVRNDGVLDFQHSSLREAVNVLLLNGLTSPSRVRNVNTPDNPWEVHKFQFHSVLSTGFSHFPCSARLVHELPWQLRVTGDVSGLKATLSRPEVFVRMWSNMKDLRIVVDFLNYWKLLILEGCDVVTTYCNMIDEIAKRSKETGNKARTQGSGHTEDLSVVENHGIVDRILCKKRGSSYTTIEVAYVAYLVGLYFLGLQEFDSADMMLQRVLKMSRAVTTIDDVDFLCQIYKSLGDLYYEWGMLEKAVGYYEDVLKTADEISRYVNIDKVQYAISEMILTGPQGRTVQK
jgi:tetratricopeptide (TPR) repeat protein